MTFEELKIPTRTDKVRYATICPQCNDKRTKHKGALCLTVNNEPGNRWYKCHHCGWSGNLDLLDKYNKVLENSRMPSKERQFSMKARDYLFKRGFTLETLKKCRVYEFINKQKETYICFPYFMNLTLVNVKFRNIDWTPESKSRKIFQLPKELGTRIIPWNLQNISFEDKETGQLKNKTLIITEGEWDTLTWIECGFENVISVPLGAPSPVAKSFDREFAWLEDPYVISIFSDIDIFYLSIDEDEAGRLLRHYLGMFLGKEKCRIIKYPKGYKDINEVLVGNKEKNLPALGKQGVIECFENAQTFPVSGVVRPFQIIDEIEKYREGGFQAGLGCGIKEIDDLFTVKPKHISFITGVPGSGKSVFIRWWLVEMIKHNESLNLKWAMFTPENRPVSREFAKIAECLTGMSIQKGFSNSMTDEVFRGAMRFIHKHFFVISPDRTNFEKWDDTSSPENVNTLNNILKYLEYLKKTENIFGYVIDAWNKIEHLQPKWMNETTFISQQLDKLIVFNDYWDLHGIIIVHPRKIEQIGENYKMPSLYDIKGSSAWKEKADIGIIVHRYKMKKITQAMARKQGIELDELDEDEKWFVLKNAPTIVKTEKIRFEELGSEGRVRLVMKEGGRFAVDKTQKSYNFEKDIREEEEKIKDIKATATKTVFNFNEEDEDLPF